MPDRSDRSPVTSRRHRWWMLALLAFAGCTGSTPENPPASFVDRVIEDVTAMVEGMAQAHGERQVVQQAPGFRSQAPAPPR